LTIVQSQSMTEKSGAELEDTDSLLNRISLVHKICISKVSSVIKVVTITSRLVVLRINDSSPMGFFFIIMYSYEEIGCLSIRTGFFHLKGSFRFQKAPVQIHKQYLLAFQLGFLMAKRSVLVLARNVAATLRQL
jgi:hypothetical protein